MKKGVIIVYNSKTLYGNAFLEAEDLAETDIDYLVELEYYRTNYVKEDSTIYGVEIVKKEHLTEETKIESKTGNIFTKNERKVKAVLEELRNGKVTPKGLADTLKNIVYTNQEIVG